MKKNNLLVFVCLLALVFITGCGDSKVTGKVSFPDGSPLTTGQVMFQKEGFIASGNIKADGTYSAGKNKDGDGIPPGQYQVFITGALVYNSGETVTDPSTGASYTPSLPPTELVASKYTAPGSSGLTVEVKGKTVFNISVEPPK